MLLITPDDSSLPPFQLGRHVDTGDGDRLDAGQIIGPTDGSRVFVYADRVGVRTMEFAVSGMTRAEALGLEEYANATLRGGVEVFTIYGSRGNIIPDSERFSDPGSGSPRWQHTGTNPPTVAAESEVGPEGYAATADVVTFGAVQSVLRAADAIPQDIVDNGGSVFVEFLARVETPGADQSGTVNSDGAASFAWTLPGDGSWKRVVGSYASPGQRWIDVESLSRAVVFAHFQAAIGSLPKFQPNTHPGVPLHSRAANARLIAGSLRFTQQREDVFGCSFSVRAEDT